MKKKILATILGAMLMTSTICSASVSTNQLELGGIKYDAQISTVENKFGKPAESKTKTKNDSEKINYKYDNVKVEFINGKVHEIEIGGNSNLKTSAGIGIGSSTSDVEKAYGKPDVTHYDKYIYYTSDQTAGIIFKIRDGKVTQIKCGSLDQIKNSDGRHKFERRNKND